MKKRHALILALLFAILIYNTIFLFSHTEEKKLQPVIVARVIDGDTLVTDSGTTIRLANINAPEKDSPLSAKAKNYISEYTGKTVLLDAITIEKYGRTLGRLYNEQGEYLNIELVNKGLSSKFLVDESELKKFSKAEDYAIENEAGIWKSSKYKDCISADIDAKSEILIIKNSCSLLNLNGWIIKDESRKQYKFKIVINNSILLHSTKGNDNSTDIFWNEESSIWNNDRDTVYIFDEENNLAFHKSYGY